MARLWSALEILDLNTSYLDPEVIAAVVATEPTPCGSLLLGALSRHPLTQEQRGRFLSLASAVARKRIQAVVSNKHRGAYHRAAELAIACAEAYSLAEVPKEGLALLTEIREEFPRHSAFQKALNGLITASPLLPNPLRKVKKWG
jgi:hypothetical protein